MADAAVFAEEYVLTHRDSERSMPPFKPYVAQFKTQTQGEDKIKESVNLKGRVCFYCKKPGHTVNQCFVLNKKTKTPKAVNLVQTRRLPDVQSPPNPTPETEDGLGVYAPFLMNGFVSLSEQSPMVPVTILRDSGALQSVLLEGVLPLSDETSVYSSALIRGIGISYIGVPLHTILLESGLVKGGVVVGVRSELPVRGVSFISSWGMT